MATTDSGWSSVSSIRGKFEPNCSGKYYTSTSSSETKSSLSGSEDLSASLNYDEKTSSHESATNGNGSNLKHESPERGSSKMYQRNTSETDKGTTMANDRKAVLSDSSHPYTSSDSSNASPILGFEERKKTFEKYLQSSYPDIQRSKRISNYTGSTADKETSQRGKSQLFTRRVRSMEESYNNTSRKISGGSIANDIFDKSSSSSESFTPKNRRKLPNLQAIKNSNKKFFRSENDKDDVTDSGFFARTKRETNDSITSRNLSSHEEKESLKQDNVPVFCVKNFEASHTRELRDNKGRSRSVGFELKKDTSTVEKQWTDSSDEENTSRPFHDNETERISGQELSNNDCANFVEKQKIIEHVISKKNNCKENENTFKKCRSPMSPSDVFKKINFTSKQDKDIQNKIAKGDLVSPITPTGNLECNFSSKNDSDNLSKSSRITKLIPKINPISNITKFNDSYKGVLQDSNFKENNTKKNGSESNTSGHKTKEKIIKELRESNFIGKSSNHFYPRRQTLPENDLILYRSQFKNEKPEVKVKRNETRPKCFPKPLVTSVQNNQPESPPIIKPSQIYKLRHTEDNLEARFNQTLSINGNDDTIESVDIPIPPPRRKNASPRKKNRAPQPPKSSGSHSSQISPILYSSPTLSANEASQSETDYQKSDSLSNSDKPSNEEPLPDLCSVDTTDSVDTILTLPMGPPPQKPPRTFAYEIYNEGKLLPTRRSTESLTEFGQKSKLSCDADSKNKQIPVYATIAKKKNRKESVGSNNKPVIAPKPTHIRSLSNGKFVPPTKSGTSTNNELLNRQQPTSDKLDSGKPISHGPIESSPQDNDLRDNHYTEPYFHTSSTRVTPPSSLSKSSHDIANKQCDSNNPKSLQYCSSNINGIYSTAPKPNSASMNNAHNGKLNRQKSMSDETLASSLAYQRIRPVTEPIYATPVLQRRKTGSGEELHYLCSDLLAPHPANGREFGGTLKKHSPFTTSRGNLIWAWKQEFRQSCRLVHDKLKKTVNR